MANSYKVANSGTLIAEMLYKGDTIYDVESGLEYRVLVEKSTGAETLSGLIAGSDVEASGEDYALSAAFGAAFPTVDPAVVGEVWSNAGVLTVSAG